MTIREKETSALEEKILKGLDLTYKKLLAEKKAKGQKMVILRNNKIVEVEP
jgi:hypothetical protein